MTITGKTGADKTPTNETSTDKISVQSKTSTRPSKRLVVMLAAGLLVVAGGITLTSVGVASAAADETARQCAVALKDSAAVTTSRTVSLAKADAALEAVKSVALPAKAGTSTVYAARPGNAEVKAVPAVEAVPAVAAEPAVAAIAGRSSGAELIASVSTARRAPVKIAIPTKCTERDSATKILALTAKSAASTRTLDSSVTVLVADFAVFQVDETARIAAEIEAEAARVAAEAAAAEAARVAAAQHAAASRPSSGSVRSGSSSAGGSWSGGSSGTPGGGGGQVGTGAGTGTPRCDNGMGGFMPCP